MCFIMGARVATGVGVVVVGSVCAYNEVQILSQACTRCSCALTCVRGRLVAAGSVASAYAALIANTSVLVRTVGARVQTDYTAVALGPPPRAIFAPPANC